MENMDQHIKKIYILIVTILWWSLSTAQDFTRKDIRLDHNGVEVKNPFVGGLLSPQFSTVDLDGDGKKDLFVFDRIGKVRLTFINEGGPGEISYRFAPEYIAIFPEVTHWILLRDYNGDGIEDIFMSPSAPGIPGIEVRLGERVNGQLQYNLVENPSQEFDILYVPISNGFTQIYVSFIDIPDIRDIDFDGDLDVLAFEPGGSTVTFYKNFTKERGLPLEDITAFEIGENCFGKFKESGFSQDVALGETASDCGFNIQDQEVSVRHAGSTILAIDENGDQLIDLILGDLSFDGLVRLQNGGTQDDAWMTSQDPNYPAYDEPLDIAIYDASYYEDVNNDGARDLIVASNNTNSLQNTDHIWLYLNIGTDDSPVFSLEMKNFLADEMLYLGSFSYPTFTDVNQDGLMDIVVGVGGYLNQVSEFGSRLYYYKNDGTSTEPSFVLENDDYLSFSEFAPSSIIFTPAFGDLDGDGDQDLIVGENLGFLFYAENNAGPRNPYSFNTPIYKYQDIRVGQDVTPSIIDVNDDGLGDLVIGERNFNSLDDRIGSLNYLENIGTVGNPVFEGLTLGNNTPFFGNINTREQNNLNNYSSPFFVPFLEDYLLFSGSESGKLSLFSMVKNNANGTINLITSDLGGIREGTRTSPTVYDIDEDGYYDMLIGNRRGGLAFYNTDIKNPSISTDEPDLPIKISISPNPVVDNLEIYTELNSVFDLQVYSSKGETMITMEALNSGEMVSVSHIPSGIYFAKVKTDEGQKVQKIIKL